MKLLIITQSVDRDNPILGFFHRWLEEFAKKYEKIIVICLEKGRYDLPENVRVLSLGKKASDGKPAVLKKIKYIWNFYKYIWRGREDYDAVFVHMNPVYVTLGGLFWVLTKKPVFLWYTHRKIDLKLRLAEKFVSTIFTASKSSLRLQTKKAVILHHGIDASSFACSRDFVWTQPVKILSVGRITPIKNCGLLIEAVNILRKDFDIRVVADFIGPVIYESDVIYKAELQKKINELGLAKEISFLEPVSHTEVGKMYCRYDMLANMSPSGGLDKAVLEGALSSMPTVLANSGFAEYFGDLASVMIFKGGDSVDLAGKIAVFCRMKAGERRVFCENLKKMILPVSDLSSLIEKIATRINEASR